MKPEQTVYRGEEAHYTLADLPPGRYRLTALAAVDEQGKEKSLPNQDSERFRLRAGERIEAVIVLKKAPVGAILGISAGVVGIVLLVAALTAIALAAALDQEPMVERPPPAPPPTPSLPPASPAIAFRRAFGPND